MFVKCGHFWDSFFDLIESFDNHIGYHVSTPVLGLDKIDFSAFTKLSI